MSVGANPSRVMCGRPRPEVLALPHMWVVTVYRGLWARAEAWTSRPLVAVISHMGRQVTTQ
jgi:hypothetical protein